MKVYKENVVGIEEDMIRMIGRSREDFPQEVFLCKTLRGEKYIS